MTPGLPFLNIHNPLTNERISVYMDKHSRMYLGIKDYFVEQISHLSKSVVIVASAQCRLFLLHYYSTLYLHQHLSVILHISCNSFNYIYVTTT